MTIEDKKKIADAVTEYISEKGISQNEFARMSGVNSAYISAILNGKFTFQNSRTGEQSDIDERWFRMISRAIGLKLQKDYWPLVQTEQFVDIAGELTQAKETASTRIIVGETGCGKSYTVQRFQQAYPAGTFVITCNRNDTIRDLVRKMMDSLKVQFDGTISYKIDKISIELSRQSDNGNHPILIFDEAEYLNLQGLLSIKTIYDYLKNTCAICLIGTQDILNKLERSLKKEGMPQFMRRFKAGIRNVRPIDRTFRKFIEGKDFDKQLITLIRNNADNYGELADFMEPALRAADERGEKLTAELFESMFYLQNK